MGHDVLPIGQHKLNTSSSQALAVQLAERFNASFIYGYQDDWIGKDHEGSFAFIEEGRIMKPGEASYMLIDCSYMDRLHKQNSEIWYDIDLSNDPDSFHFSVYEYNFNCNAHFDSRWWNFCRCFTGEITEPSFINYVHDFRKEVRGEVRRLGGECVIYCDDQGPSAWAGDNTTINWNEMVQKLKDDFGENFLAVSDFFKNNHPFRTEYPLAFFDDFDDLAE